MDAYTVHVYDWVDAERQGISRVTYDFDNALGNPCVNGRRLPVIVEEIGTSRAIPGLYAAGEVAGSLDIIGMPKGVVMGRIAGESAAAEKVTSERQ